MNLPPELQIAIEREVDRFKPSELKGNAEQLSREYREVRYTPVPPMRTDAHRCAYLATRMPATYGAISSALAQAKLTLESLGISSVLDLGAGPGTASWAATHLLSTIQHMTLLEKDSALASIGKSLAEFSLNPALKEAEWISTDLVSVPAFEPKDLVILSYVLTEIQPQHHLSVIQKAWRAAQKAFVIIVPGTPAAFDSLRKTRTFLLEAGGTILAPCPHAIQCPMKPNDWCHFSARIERTKLHRYLKSGDHGYEDEKFSYLVVGKSSSTTQTPPRILRHPTYSPNTVELTLCSETGQTTKKIVKKSEKTLYKRARKVRWGDPWD